MCGRYCHVSWAAWLPEVLSVFQAKQLLLLNIQGSWNTNLLGGHLNLTQKQISLVWGILKVSLKETGLEGEIKRGPREKIHRYEDGRQYRPRWGTAEVLRTKWLCPTIWEPYYCHQGPLSLEDDSLLTDSFSFSSLSHHPPLPLQSLYVSKKSPAGG